MTRLNVPDMSCGHCKATIEKAVGSVDPAARVSVDLAAKTVDVVSSAADSAIVSALNSKGFAATVQL